MQLGDGSRLRQNIGLELDARLVAYLVSEDQQLDNVLALAGFVVPATNTRVWRFNAIYGLLWARGHAIRSNHLQFSNRFGRTTRSFERLLVQRWLTPRLAPVSSAAVGWPNELLVRLRSHGRASVRFEAGDTRGIRQAISYITSTPVQLEYLNLYGRVGSVRRQDGAIHIEFELPEAA